VTSVSCRPTCLPPPRSVSWYSSILHCSRLRVNPSLFLPRAVLLRFHQLSIVPLPNVFGSSARNHLSPHVFFLSGMRFLTRRCLRAGIRLLSILRGSSAAVFAFFLSAVLVFDDCERSFTCQHLLRGHFSRFIPGAIDLFVPRHFSTPPSAKLLIWCVAFFSSVPACSPFVKWLTSFFRLSPSSRPFPLLVFV